MRKITADYLHPISSTPIPNGVLILDDDGKILAIEKQEAHDATSLEKYSGILVPGFINAHCHLELSHMKGKVDTGTGLLPFITNVVSFRDVPQEEIQEAIENADREMQEAGIVAVGDISNKIDTFQRKAVSPIRYYSFIEMFDFIQDAMAEATFQQYKAVYDQHPEGNGNQFTAVPHAPYSVSASLFNKINTLNNGQGTVSIHNQETPDEQDLFLHKGGGFPELFGSFGMSFEDFKPTGKTAIHYALDNMDAACKTLFVHNTLTNKADIEAAHNWNDKVYWASCPNANLYIENRLPDYQAFLDTDAKVCLGTDSLTSNWQLSILEEMKTISRYKSFIPLEILLKWATINGAEALGFDDVLGSFEVGKSPGVNLISGLDGNSLGQNSKVVKLV